MKARLSEAELINWITNITTEFYELVYNDPWFSKIFRNIKQEVITSQQIDFMVQSFGGPKRFGGRVPKDAHPQIWIDDNIWNYREELLKKSFQKTNAPIELQEKWLRIDEAFKAGIVNKGGPEECEGRYRTDEIIYEPMPISKKKAA